MANINQHHSTKPSVNLLSTTLKETCDIHYKFHIWPITSAFGFSALFLQWAREMPPTWTIRRFLSRFSSSSLWWCQIARSQLFVLVHPGCLISPASRKIKSEKEWKENKRLKEIITVNGKLGIREETTRRMSQETIPKYRNESDRREAKWVIQKWLEKKDYKQSWQQEIWNQITRWSERYSVWFPENGDNYCDTRYELIIISSLFSPRTLWQL